MQYVHMHKKFGNLHNVCAAPVEKLVKVDNVGVRTAQYLKMLPEFVKAYQVSCFGEKHTFNSPGKVYF